MSVEIVVKVTLTMQTLAFTVIIPVDAIWNNGLRYGFIVTMDSAATI